MKTLKFMYLNSILLLYCFSSTAFAAIPWQNQIAFLSGAQLFVPYVKSDTIDLSYAKFNLSGLTVTLDELIPYPDGTPEPEYTVDLSTSEPATFVIYVNSLYLTADANWVSGDSWLFDAESLDYPPWGDTFGAKEPVDCYTFSDGTDPNRSWLIARVTQLLNPTPPNNSSKPTGAFVAIVKDGTFITAEGLGKVYYGSGPPPSVDENTLFLLGSTTKFVSSVGMANLAEEGIMELEEPITTYLEDYTESSCGSPPCDEDLINFRTLLQHKSGFETDSDATQTSVSGCAANTREETILGLDVATMTTPTAFDTCGSFLGAAGAGGPVLKNLFATTPTTPLAVFPWKSFNSTASYGNPNLNFTPGFGEAPFHYSNWGFVVASRAAEQIVEDRETAFQQFMSFPDIMRQRVFEPAGICGVKYSGHDDISSNFAYGVSPNNSAEPFWNQCPEPNVHDGEPVFGLGHDSKPHFHPEELACPMRSAVGGLWMSAVQMGRFAEVLINDLPTTGANVVLNPSFANRLFEPDPEDATHGGRFVFIPKPSFLPTAGGGVEPEEAEATYGLGNVHINIKTSVDPLEFRELYGHWGSRPGFVSVLWIAPEEEFAVAMAFNNSVTGTSNMMSAAMDIIACYLDAECN